MATIGKRKRSITSMSPEKIRALSPQFKTLSRCTTNRIKRYLPGDVNFISTIYNEASFTEFDKLKGSATKEKVAILIGIIGYLPGANIVHGNHSVAAFKWGNTLYCFDPWGKDRKRKADDIFYFINSFTKCDKVVVYNGVNLQTMDSTGVCVGLSSNFLMILAKRQRRITKYFDSTIYFHLIQIPVKNIEAELVRKTYAMSVKTIKGLRSS